MDSQLSTKALQGFEPNAEAEIGQNRKAQECGDIRARLLNQMAAGRGSLGDIRCEAWEAGHWQAAEPGRLRGPAWRPGQAPAAIAWARRQQGQEAGWGH